MRDSDDYRLIFEFIRIHSRSPLERFDESKWADLSKRRDFGFSINNYEAHVPVCNG
jgi:hypothetical protein